MTNNDILRKIRYSIDLDDNSMIEIFSLADYKTTRAQVSDWLKKDEDESFKSMNDTQLATFLNGLIYKKRGKIEDKLMPIEKKLNNNIIFRKIKIAFNWKDEDILALFNSINFRISKHEISAFFRNINHKHYRQCHDQILRNLLLAMQKKYRN